MNKLFHQPFLLDPCKENPFCSALLAHCDGSPPVSGGFPSPGDSNADLGRSGDVVPYPLFMLLHKKTAVNADDNTYNPEHYNDVIMITMAPQIKVDAIQIFNMAVQSHISRTRDLFLNARLAWCSIYRFIKSMSNMEVNNNVCTSIRNIPHTIKSASPCPTDICIMYSSWHNCSIAFSS